MLKNIETNSSKGERLLKNTMFLYMRMFLLMGVNFYTSRVILDALGIEDFGLYNVVGGFVAMFSILNKSLSSACSRFFNVEMGHGNMERLKMVFSMSVTIHVFLTFVIALLCFVIGIWYVNTYMVIPRGRLFAANWVLIFSIITFVSNLITIPYNAAIIAHEQMKAFAYISLLEAFAKLGISYAVIMSPIDSLIFYSILICILQLTIQFIYRVYCRKNFAECIYHICFEKKLMKQILGFASWNFVGTTAVVLRNQGNNIVLNLFFGPVVNAARGISNQVLHVVGGFVGNFMIAMNPQITQSYAANNYDYMYKLVTQGARFSFYLLLLISLPIIFNADYLLHIWLKEVPDYSMSFVQLSLVLSIISSLSNPLITLQLATGNIRNYQLIIGGIIFLNVPVSYVFLYYGCFPEIVIMVAIFFELICLLLRLLILRKMIKFDAIGFFKNVICNVAIVTISSVIVPMLLYNHMEKCLFSFVIISLSAFLFAGISIYFVGCNKNDKVVVQNGMKKVVERLFNSKL